MHTTSRNPTKMTTCSLCGALRRGTDLAPAKNRFYCNGVLDESPTCYEQEILGVPDGR